MGRIGPIGLIDLDTVLARNFFRCICISLCLGGTAEAHHSRANYDMQTFQEYDGTVVEFAWTNPHAYVVIDVDDGQGGTRRLLLEMNSKPILSRMGWRQESLEVGDKVHVRGNPDRLANRDQLFVAYVINRDGEKLWSFGRPREEAQRFARENPVERKPLVGSTDFSGVWNRARLSNEERRQRSRFGAADLPVTKQGQVALDQFNPNDDPVFECLPRTLPQTIVPVYPMEVRWENESLLTIQYETNDEHRTIHMNQAEFPTGIAPSRMGYSIGEIRDGALEISTQYFTADRWGIGRGVPSGEQKTVFERYTLSDDGERMEVLYTYSDPDYLTEAVTDRGAYVLRNDYVLSEYECNPEAAVRHLTGLEEN